jgi:NAD(P)-dependent dehydrogenase (short-subunit alcohol dehydrogenase family)
MPAADAREHKVEPAAFSHEIDVNLKGVMNGTKVVLADMGARGAGTIINISSVSDRKTAPVAVGYTASKYGVRALSESLREAEGKNGVRAINVAPGYVRTNIHAGMGTTSTAPRSATRFHVGRGAGRHRALVLEAAGAHLRQGHRRDADKNYVLRWWTARTGPILLRTRVC